MQVRHRTRRSGYGWNGRHTAVTLPDGTPGASGEGAGLRVGGGGAYQPQFNHQVYLPVDGDAPADPRRLSW